METISIESGARASNARTWAFRGAVAAILLVAAVVRMDDLRALPPFIDESGHILLAVDYSALTLVDRLRTGKVFGFVAFYPIARFAQDPLLAARLSIAVLGVLTTLGVMLFTRRLATAPAAILAGVLWATMPYVVFYDRMALHDPLISAFLVWSLYGLAVALDRNSKLIAALAGVLLGLAVVTKVIAVLLAAFPVLIVLMPRGWRALRARVATLAAFAAPPLVATVVMGLGPLMGIPTGDQFLRGADSLTWQLVWLNGLAAPTWLSEFNSMPFTILAGVTLIGGMLTPSRVKAALVLSLLISVVGHAVVLKLWFSRYFLASLLPLVILMAIVLAEWTARAAAAVSRRRSREPQDWFAVSATLAAVVLVAGFAPAWLKSDLAFSSDPTTASMPPADRHQYMDGWPSGYGMAEVVAFINQRSRESGKLLVIVGGFARPGSWTLPLAAKLDPNVTVRSEHVFTYHNLANAAAAARQQPTFMLFEPPQYELPESLLVLVTPRPKLVFDYTRRDEGRWALYAIDPSTQVASPK